MFGLHHGLNDKHIEYIKGMKITKITKYELCNLYKYKNNKLIKTNV